MARTIGTLPLGLGGESFVVLEWEPDPKIIEAEMIKAASVFADWEDPLLEVRELMIENTRMLFEEEKDPFEIPWQKLDEDYLASKLAAGFSDKILERTGDLEQAATSEEAWIVTEDAVFFNTGALPTDEKSGANYGALHQSGTQEAGAIHLGHLDIAIAKMGAGLGINSLSPQEREALAKGGRGLNLPQRMFIGATEETIGEIETVFLAHLETTIEEMVGEEVTTTRGTIGVFTEFPAIGGGFSVRGEGGRFTGAFRGG